MCIRDRFGLALLATPEAQAHTIEYRPGYAYAYYGAAGTRYFPRWLRKDRGFQHWYWHSRYRFKRHLSWNRLYRMYRYERRFARIHYDYHYDDRGYYKRKRRW